MNINEKILIAINEIRTQEQIEKLVSESTTDELTKALLRENIASAIRTQNFYAELQRY